MFSIAEKRHIAEAVQQVLRATNHPELPAGEIQFTLRVDGAEDWSWAEIHNNGAVLNTERDFNPWNERVVIPNEEVFWRNQPGHEHDTNEQFNDPTQRKR